MNPITTIIRLFRSKPKEEVVWRGVIPQNRPIDPRIAQMRKHRKAVLKRRKLLQKYAEAHPLSI